MISLRNNERVTLTDKGLRLVTLTMTNEVPFGVFRKLSSLSENFEVNPIESKSSLCKDIVRWIRGNHIHGVRDFDLGRRC